MKSLKIKTAAALGLVTLALGAATPAFAHWDNDGDGSRAAEWREHQAREREWRERAEWRERQEWREREWREHHRGWYGYGPYGRGYYDGPIRYRPRYGRSHVYVGVGF